MGIVLPIKNRTFPMFGTVSAKAVGPLQDWNPQAVSGPVVLIKEWNLSL